MKPGVKIALGVFTAILTMSFVVVYDVYIKDKIDSVEVVTVKAGAEILKNEPIDKSKLSISLREKSGLIDGAIRPDQLDRIIGVEAGQTIVGNSMITEEMLNRDLLIPDPEKGEKVRPLIADWIFATPGSLRRKDQIDIYVIKVESEKPGVTVVSGNKEGETGDEVLGPVLEKVKVIYAKDNSNKEVIGANDARGQDKRLDGTAKIADIEVILNEEDFEILTDYVVGKGYKLYITYN